MDQRLENYVYDSLERLDDNDGDNRVVETDLMTNIFKTLNNYNPGMSPSGQALSEASKQLNESGIGQEIGKVATAKFLTSINLVSISLINSIRFLS